MTTLAQTQPLPTGTTTTAKTPVAGSETQPSLLDSALPELGPDTKHEISFSGDFHFGQGYVTMPFSFSLLKSGFTVTPAVGSPTRSSEYIGGTLSYSLGQSWYFDVSYSQGSSSGNADVPLGTTSQGSPFLIPSAFTINDTWYQGYVRYTFPSLRGKKFSAYASAGVSYVTAKLNDDSVIPALGIYHQTDKTRDILGNVGFGLSRSLYRGDRSRLALQFEGLGFFGFRSQDSLEILPNRQIPIFQAAAIDNTLYGGVGRLTLRYQYELGKSGLFKVFIDGGVQSTFTLVQYSSSDLFKGGSFNELLWGPYVKLGLRYSF